MEGFWVNLKIMIASLDQKKMGTWLTDLYLTKFARTDSAQLHNIEWWLHAKEFLSFMTFKYSSYECEAKIESEQQMELRWIKNLFYWFGGNIDEKNCSFAISITTGYTAINGTTYWHWFPNMLYIWDWVNHRCRWISNIQQTASVRYLNIWIFMTSDTSSEYRYVRVRLTKFLEIFNA